MKEKFLKEESKGITLIALVITIIVLLILAGITISMIAGQDSAPQKAVEARNANKMGEAKDAATLLITDYMQQYYNGKYISNDEEAKNATDIGTYISGKLATPVTRGNHIMQVENGDLIVKDKNGNEIVRGAIEDNGTIRWSGEATSEKDEETKSWLAKDVLTLTEDPNDNTKLISPYVNYTLKGQTTPTLCKVLYNDGTNVEIIPVNPVAKVKLGWSDETVTSEQVAAEKARLSPDLLGGYKSDVDNNYSIEATKDDFAVAKISYNNVVETLNTKAAEYMNENLSSTARCVGTDPSNPYLDNPGMFEDTTYDYLTTFKLNDGTFKNTDTIPNIDIAQLKKVSAYYVSDESYGYHYWLASRRVSLDSSTQDVFFSVRAISMPGTVRSLDLCRVHKNGQPSLHEYENSLRPIFNLKSTVQIVDDGNDGTKEHPYNLN